jgi:hypothetical protein
MRKAWLVLIPVALAVIIKCVSTNYSYTYAVPSENGGLHYVYYTEASCKVTDVTEDRVYVQYKGNTYSFYYSDGTDCKKGDRWIVTFDENMHIIDVK